MDSEPKINKKKTAEHVSEKPSPEHALPDSSPETTSPDKDQELNAFMRKLDAGEFDGRLFEEIRKLRSEHLARICRLLSQRKFKEK